MDDPPAVSVLLVDDDVDWVETTGAALERADDALSVITATGGWEALDLLDRDDFDCVVCDYRMPDFDGIALLERIRAEHGDVPFILVTGAGSEAVASRAISSAVTDYFIKEPGREQARALGMRIRAAVDAHRTEQALDAARRRFAGLFERVPDPVAIADAGGDLREVNDAFADVFDVEPAAVTGTTVREAVGEASDEFPEAPDGSTIRRLATETADGSRTFLVRRFALGEGVEVGYVFTDVTSQRDRERALERFYELAAEVRELLLSAPSRGALERGFCETVAATVDGSVALLVDASGTDGWGVRAAAGDVSDRVESALVDPATDQGTTEADDHPVSGALDEGVPRYVPDLASVGTEWSAELRAGGVDELLAVPVERAGLPAGVFVVCTSSGGTLQEDARERLASLASSLGDAMDLVDRATALTGEEVVRVRVSVDDASSLLNAVSREAGVGIAGIAAASRGDDLASVYLSLDGGDPEAVAASADAVEGVVDAEAVGARERVRLEVDASAPTVATTLAREAATLHSVQVTEGRTTVAFDVPLSGDVRTVVSAIEDAFEGVTVLSVRTVPAADALAGDEAALAGLTDKQRGALRTAYHEGYFERPRARSADEVAGTLGVSRSTFLQHLRAAERKLLASVFEDESAAEGP